MSPRLTAIVPTVGLSPLLARCLEALRADGGDQMRIVLVHQGARPLPLDDDARRCLDRTIELDRNLGFAGGVNVALDELDCDLVALVNDDAVVAHGWCRKLTDQLARVPLAGAAQGINLLGVAETSPSVPRIDGAGIAFNRWLQAVQIGRGAAASDAPSQPVEVFGVSATAALYRRSALEQSRIDRRVLDERLVSYYEDVDLACRLRAAGYTSWLVPSARVEHVGSLTGGRDRRRYTTLVYGNRWLVASRLLGTRFVARLPTMLVRDLLDLARSPQGDGRHVPSGVALGWLRALRLLPRFARLGPPLITKDQLQRLALERIEGAFV